MNRKLELSKPLYKQNLLYVDDLRNPPNKLRQEYNIIICRNYEEAIYELDKRRCRIIDLDHDLGEEKTGYDICKYIIKNNIEITKIYIHTSNPVGRFNMYQLLHRYCKCDIIPY